MEQAIDRYQLIKKFFIVGTVANLYFCYVSFVKYSIYSEVSDNIMEKFEEFNNTKTKNKEMILELMREMDSMQAQKNQLNSPSIQANNLQSPNSANPITKT